MAERAYPKRKQLRLPSHDYAEPGSYFITVCTQVRGQDVLGCVAPAVGDGLCAVPPAVKNGPCAVPSVTVRLTEIGRIVDKAIQDIPSLYTGVSVDIRCVMPDHIHLLIVLGAGRDRARPLPESSVG